MSNYLDSEADMARGRADDAQKPKATRPAGPRRPRTVLVLMAVLRYSMDNAARDLMAVNKAMGSIKRRPVMHGDRTIGWVLETHFNADEVMTLTRGALSRDCFANAWCFTPGADIASLLPLDPLTERVAEAWSSVRDWNARLPVKQRDALLAIARPMRDGRGLSATRILDDHPLLRRSAA
jgi:hypothetical protein